MSREPKYLVGELVELGTPSEGAQPRAVVVCTEADIAAVKWVPMMRRVAIVPLDDLNGSDVPPVVAENQLLRAELAAFKANNLDIIARHNAAVAEVARLEQLLSGKAA